MSEQKTITRCAKWIRGRQCPNYTSGTSNYCAMHKQPEPRRV